MIVCHCKVVSDRAIARAIHDGARTVSEVCHELGDHGTAAVFEEMVRDEERQVDWFESQLGAVDRVGIAQYLAQQIEPGSAPS